MTLKALSVKQPWALAICHGKDVENRTWETKYRGFIAIHASKAFDDVSLAVLDWIEATARLAPGQLHKEDHRGAVVAVAEIVGCHLACADDQIIPGAPPILCSPWALEGQWHWELDNVCPLPEPVPCRGALGLWRLPDEVVAAIPAQLARKAGAP
ncbi:hypothetical protein ACGFNU_21610 [Spirillospora sp. NPDC048911]|uniref:hypothetical protein n=1 Tax=Spirillospora sp. NPDC048911 TaxID=3364527 RepID=UPI003714D45A